MTNREQQVVDAAEYEGEMESVASILNTAFDNDPVELRDGMREKFGEHLDAKNPRIGPTRGLQHEYAPHGKECVWCGCLKSWLVSLGSKVCSAHTTQAKLTERRNGRPD